MFHGLDASKPQSIFKYLPILSFTESYIYQVHIRLMLLSSATLLFILVEYFFESVGVCTWVSTACVEQTINPKASVARRPKS